MKLEPLTTPSAPQGAPEFPVTPPEAIVIDNGTVARVPEQPAVPKELPTVAPVQSPEPVK